MALAACLVMGGLLGVEVVCAALPDCNNTIDNSTKVNTQSCNITWAIRKHLSAITLPAGTTITVNATGSANFTIAPQAPTGIPSNVQFPFGLLALNATLLSGKTCITGNVTITPVYPTLNSYYKQTSSGGWADAIQSIQNTGGKTIITFKACDGGQFDLDNCGTNAKIVDPGAPSIVSSSVPNYGYLGLTLLVMLLAAIGAKALDRAST